MRRQKDGGRHQLRFGHKIQNCKADAERKQQGQTEMKSPRPISRRGRFELSDGGLMAVICPTRQMFLRHSECCSRTLSSQPAPATTASQDACLFAREQVYYSQVLSNAGVNAGELAATAGVEFRPNFLTCRMN
jgi:hypothetical protein